MKKFDCVVYANYFAIWKWLLNSHFKFEFSTVKTSCDDKFGILKKSYF